MERDEIKREIVSRLQLEAEVRKQLKLEESEGSQPKSWLRSSIESKLGLLVAGAVLSGVLVPTFQFTQERIKWRQQNQYDALQRQLGGIRESLKQFVEVQAVSASLYNLGTSLLDHGATNADERAKKLVELRTLQEKRIQQNAAFASSIFYFPADFQEKIRAGWNRMIVPIQKLDGTVAILLEQGSKEQATIRDAPLELDSRLAEVNGAYDDLVSMLQDRLREVENASSRFQ